MGQNRTGCILLSIIFLYLFNGCTRHGDTNPPSIVINSPTAGNSFKVFDTIPVSGQVTDDKRLTALSITLLDASGSPAGATATIPISGRSMAFSYLYEILNIHLVSGLYTVKVSASNGTQVSNAFVHVYIQQSPTYRKGIYLISRNSSNVSVSMLDTGFHSFPVTSINGDYIASDISSYSQQLYLTGASTGGVSALNLRSGMTDWTKPLVPGFTPSYDFIYANGNVIYSSARNGMVLGYDTSGGQRFTANCQASYYPRKLFVLGDLLLAEAVNSSGAEKLVVFKTATGTGIQEAILNNSVLAFFKQDASHVFVFGNAAGQGTVNVYAVTGNGFWSPRSLPAGTLLSATQVDADTYLLGMSDGTVYKYQYSTSSITVYLSGALASVLYFDPLKNDVLLANGKQLNRYDYPSAVLKQQFLHVDTIQNFHVLNTK
jgi:hypothetical protein